MFFVQALKDLSDDDGRQENDEEKVEHEQHVGDLLGPLRSSTRLAFERRLTEREEETIGDDTGADGHDQERNENVGEQIDDVVGLLEELEIGSRRVMRADDDLAG